MEPANPIVLDILTQYKTFFDSQNRYMFTYDLTGIQTRDVSRLRGTLKSIGINTELDSQDSDKLLVFPKSRVTGEHLQVKYLASLQ